MSSRYLTILDWILRITGVIGFVSFANNLGTWQLLFSQIWQWLGSFSLGEAAQVIIRGLAWFYEIIANLLLGWLDDDKLRDSLMLFGALVGILIIRMSLFKRFPMISVCVYISSVTTLYLTHKYISALPDIGAVTDASLFKSLALFCKSHALEIMATCTPGMLIVAYMLFIRPNSGRDDFSFQSVSGYKIWFFAVMIFVMFSWATGIGMDIFDILHVRVPPPTVDQ